jgi:glycyl-tRNA synthetase beta chain
MAEFLLELLSEEIPARMQARAAEDLRRLVCQGLDRAGLSYTRARAFVTPRRLALVVEGLPERQPDVREERKGPRVGSPEPAIQGFLRAAGLNSLNEAELRDTGKGRFYFATLVKAGRPTPDVLAVIVGEVLLAFPWPKSMRWAAGEVRWVRPLHAILALFAGRALAFSFDLAKDALPPLPAVAATVGHRFLAPDCFPVANFADYQAKLAAARVVLDPDERRALIRVEAERLAAAEGLRLRDDAGLLDEVTGLVEWPVVRLGRIDPAFMEVPPEVLITAMRTHQKYFSLLDTDGSLGPRFIVVANTETSDGGAAVVAGNERVLRARLSDAKYFWDQDRKQPLEARVPKLAERVFHARLGSDFWRTTRLTRLAPEISRQAGCADKASSAATAAFICKADLTSQMVGEFPELQGVMGRYYALHDGEPAEVANAVAEHYAPKGPADTCPTARVSIAVALADKLDTLIGFFAIGEKPTGSGDPYALRRAALGTIRLIIENRLRLQLRNLFRYALDLYLTSPEDAASDALQTVDQGALAEDLLAFFADRLKVHLREQGVRHDLIAAVFAGGEEDDLVRLLARVNALRDFLDTDDGANLLTAYRRASNIVRIEEAKDGVTYDGEAECWPSSQQQEIDLHRALSDARERIAEAISEERFTQAMAILAGLRRPVDAFFDHVQVNCAEPQLRVNRLRLLSQVRSALGEVADFSQIEG